MNMPADVVSAWMQHARSDMQLGRVALRARDVLPKAPVSHAQQCAEKALKALLLHRELPFPEKEGFEVLLGLLKADGVSIPNGVDEALRFPNMPSKPVTRASGNLSRKPEARRQLSKPVWSWPGWKPFWSNERR